MLENKDDSEIKNSKVAVNVELVPEYEIDGAKSPDRKGRALEDRRALDDAFYQDGIN